MEQGDLTRFRAMIDHRLALVPAACKCDPLLKDAMAYALEGGKRLRGSILLSFYEALGGAVEDGLDFAAAIEMIQAYSLVHDDLPCMDDDDFRRGKPSCHKQFGYAIALLAGDALLTAAFEVAASSSAHSAAHSLTHSPSSSSVHPAAPSASSPLPPERVARGIAILAAAAGPSGMVGGQVLDLATEGRSMEFEQFTEVYALKTGALFQAASRLGAVLAGASPEMEDAASRWGSLFGYAFQALDDVEDADRDQSFVASARSAATQALTNALSALDQMESRPQLAVDLVERYLVRTD